MQYVEPSTKKFVPTKQPYSALAHVDYCLAVGKDMKTCVTQNSVQFRCIGAQADAVETSTLNARFISIYNGFEAPVAVLPQLSFAAVI